MGGMDGLAGDGLSGPEDHIGGLHCLCQMRPQVAIFHHISHRTLTEIFIAKLHYKGRRGFAGSAIAYFDLQHGLGVICQIFPQSQRVEHILTGGGKRI